MTIKHKPITQKRLKELLKYNPGTGVFSWIKGRGGRKPGSVAGCLNPDGYVQIYVDRHNYRAHVLAWIYLNGEYPSQWIDHINRVRDDNRESNLRLVSPHENGCNQSIRSDNKSGCKGVNWDKVNKKWRVEINAKNTRLRIGRFSDLELASLIAEEAREKYHGVFSCS